MARFCVNCGSEIADGMAFCSSCGTKAEDALIQEQLRTEEEQPIAAQEPTQAAPATPVNGAQATAYTAPQPQQQHTGYTQQSTYYGQPSYSPPHANQRPAPQASTAECKPVSTGGFFGLMLLFALPIVGWLICIIMAFAPKNKSLKNYARANLIWLLIGVILAILLGIAAMTLGNLVADLFQGFSLGFNLEEIFGIGDISGIGELSGIEDISGLEDILGQIGELEGQIPVE